MPAASPKTSLKRELRELMRSMDYVSRHPALGRKRKGHEAKMLAEIYQQLGLAWEFLALQCRHGDGWRKASGGQQVCRTCGLVKGAEERWLLLSRAGRKTIGRRAVPAGAQTLPDKKRAAIVNDTIEFHGAKLNVDVHHAYRSRLFRRMDITVSAERSVRLTEDGAECSLDQHMLRIRLPSETKQGLPYGAFLWEPPRKALKRFPVMLEHDQRGKFVGLTIFRPSSKPKPGTHD